jgi:hypothetical protein
LVRSWRGCSKAKAGWRNTETRTTDGAANHGEADASTHACDSKAGKPQNGLLNKGGTNDDSGKPGTLLEPTYDGLAGGIAQ